MPIVTYQSPFLYKLEFVITINNRESQYSFQTKPKKCHTILYLERFSIMSNKKPK